MTDRSERQKIFESTHRFQTRIIHEGNLLTLKCDKFVDSSSLVHEYDIVLHPGAVVLIPIDDQERLYFVKQYRRAAEEIMIEFPAGILEKEESPTFCATRELREEIGYKPETLIPLGGFYSSPGFSNEFIHIFIAKDLIRSPLIAEDTDKIDVLCLTLEEALNAINLQQIVDAKTICGIYMYQQWQTNTKAVSKKS